MFRTSVKASVREKNIVKKQIISKERIKEGYIRKNLFLIHRHLTSFPIVLDIKRYPESATKTVLKTKAPFEKYIKALKTGILNITM